MLRAADTACRTGFPDLNCFIERIATAPGRLMAGAALLVLGLAAAGNPAARGQDLLEPGEAFRFEARMAAPETLEVTWRIADGHYMYRQAFAVSAPEGGVVLGEPGFPEGRTKHDEFFGESVVYESDVTFTVPVTPIADGLTGFVVEATGQGCNEPVGVCYPPMTETLTVALEAAGSSTPQSLMTQLRRDPSADDAPEEGGAGQTAFLHPDEAFRFELTAMSHDTLLARFFIEPGYYLYRDKFSVDSPDDAVSVAGVELPDGRKKTDEYFGDIEAYYDGFDAQITLNRGATQGATVPIALGYQGCAEDGICYPPIEKTVSLRLPGIGEAVAAPGADPAPDGGSRFQSGYWPVLLALGSGLLLTFTPCVLPMVPILAGIIVGQGGGVTRLRGGGLAAVYVLGTAVTYTAVGVVAGLTGDQLQAYFQNIWAIGFIAVLMVLMALSMFGFYELRMPSAVQTRLQHRATGLKAGAFGGVFAMGMVSALIVGACVSPVLISILGLAINRGDPVLGGAIMFAMAMGMGVFLIAMGFGFGYLLPKSGPWMEHVKRVFGIMLLGVAVYLLGAVPAVPVLFLWAALLLGTAVYLGVHGTARESPGWKVGRQLIAVVLVAWGVLAVLGGMQGNRDILRPFDYQAVSQAAEERSGVHAEFQPVTDRESLDRLMEAARERGRPVMVDYYADWCVDCVRMESTTFAEPRVARILNEQFALLQVDVTDPNDPGTRAVKRAHGVFGPPAMLFFDEHGDEVPDMRRYGYMDGDDLLGHIAPLSRR